MTSLKELIVTQNLTFFIVQLQLPDDIEWHFIGNLQSNKVKPLIGKENLLMKFN